MRRTNVTTRPLVETAYGRSALHEPMRVDAPAAATSAANLIALSTVSSACRFRREAARRALLCFGGAAHLHHLGDDRQRDLFGRLGADVEAGGAAQLLDELRRDAFVQAALAREHRFAAAAH